MLKQNSERGGGNQRKVHKFFKGVVGQQGLQTHGPDDGEEDMNNVCKRKYT